MIYLNKITSVARYGSIDTQDNTLLVCQYLNYQGNNFPWEKYFLRKINDPRKSLLKAYNIKEQGKD